MGQILGPTAHTASSSITFITFHYRPGAAVGTPTLARAGNHTDPGKPRVPSGCASCPTGGLGLAGPRGEKVKGHV